MILPGIIGLPTQNPFEKAAWLTVPMSTSAIEQANWIWVQRPGEAVPTAEKATPGTVRFSKKWQLTDAPSRATLTFRADNSCVVKINGKVAGKSERWDQSTVLEVKSLLKAGENFIEVEATNGVGSAGQLNPAGLIFALEATAPSGKTVSLTTDSSWASQDGSVVAVGVYNAAPWNLGPSSVPAPAFRHEFSLRGQPTRAVAKIIGLGQFDFYANGQRQGKGVINGPWSQYNRTLYWQEFDITKSLKLGSNAVGVELGNSFYRVETPPPGRHAKGDAMPNFSGTSPYLLSAVIEITYADGGSEQIVTDTSWRYGPSPYTLSHVYAGEDYDARLFDPNWSKPGFKRDTWKAPLLAKKPTAELLPQHWPEFRAVKSWKPSKILQPKPGVWTYVFPQNAMATLRFKVKGPRGATVKFKGSEVMTPDGEVQQLNLWGAESSCSYTLRGGKSETHEWRFFFHGFQFVEMTGAVPAGEPNPDNLPVIESLELVHVRTDSPTIGQFSASTPLFNQIHSLVDWAVQSNMAYFLSDCPHREKLGWLECAHLLFSTVAYRYDAQEWFHKICRDMRDIQLEDGRVTTVAPDYLMLPVTSPYKFTIEWGAASVLLPWQAYEWYGDKRFLTDNFEMMCRFVDWIDTNAVDGLAPAGLGDWYDYGHGQSPGPSRFTPTQLTGTAMWAMCADAVANAADTIGKPDLAKKYRTMKEKIRGDFLRHFYDSTAKVFKNQGSVQSGHAMALCADLVPHEDRAAVLNAIIKDLEARDYQQTPGDVGHLFFIRALVAGGRSDILHKVYSRTGVGSYGGIIAKGLTTMPETWDAITVGSNSLNHCMLGHVMEWFYGSVVGIRQAPGSVGWKSILVAPEPGPLTEAKGETRVPGGRVAVQWKQGKTFSMDVSVPQGSTAIVVLPLKVSSVKLNGKTIETKLDDVGRDTLELGPGRSKVEAVPSAPR